MFPGRMSRVILDGNLDIRDYMDGLWLTNTRDAEEIIKYFYDSCFEAFEKCPLWMPEDRSGEDIQGRLEDFFHRADVTPLSFLTGNGEGSEVSVITGYDLRNTFMGPIYRPLPVAFELLADALAKALKGNYSGVGYRNSQPNLQRACDINNMSFDGLVSTRDGVVCGDGGFADPNGPHRNHRSDNPEYWAQWAGKQKQQSPTLGALYTTVVTSCVGWRVQPKWRFNGPFITPPANVSLQGGVPAAPILFISTRLDPVTPLHNAYVMSNDHPGSAVLVLDSVGHCSIGGGWSECLNAHIRAYLDDGVLPDNGTVCADTTCKPFDEDGRCQPPPSVIEALGHDGNWDAPRFRDLLGVPF